MIDIPLRLPPGVLFINMPDHSLIIRCAPIDVLKLRETMLTIASDMSRIALQAKENEKARELALQKAPVNKIEKIDQEIEALKATVNG